MEHDIKKKYFELLALKILEYYAKINICNFEHDEKPDWQDMKNSIGIEITRNSEGTKFWSNLNKLKDKKIDERKIKKFNKRFTAIGGRIITKKVADILGIECTFKFNENYVYIIPSYNNDFEKINKIIWKKTKKLNTNYNNKIRENRLFIFTPLQLSSLILKKGIIEIGNIQNKFNRNFKIIYICTLSKLYLFDLERNNYEIINLQRKEIEKISKEVYDEQLKL